MKKLSILSLLIILFFASCKDKHPIEKKESFYVTDDLNNKIEFSSIPKRIITLAPNLTEMIYAIGAGEFLVGDTKYCDYPEAAKYITKVGDMLTFDYEKIVTLKPDLIFISVVGNTKETYDKFRQLGLKIFVSNPTNYAGIRKTFQDFGKIFGLSEKADSITVRWDEIVNTVKTKSMQYPVKSVLFLVDIRPVMAAGGNTFLNEFTSLCNLRNIAENSPLNYPVFSREEILKQNPDYIIVPSDGKETIDIIKDAYPEWKNLKAFKRRNLILADRNLYYRPGPRFVDALVNLFNRLHPDNKLDLANGL